MDGYCWSEIGQLINNGKEILNASFNEQVHAVLNGYETLRFKMAREAIVHIIDANDNICTLDTSIQFDKPCYNIKIGHGLTRRVYSYREKRWMSNGVQELLNTFSNELQSFIILLIDNINIVNYVFNVEKQICDVVFNAFRGYTLNKLREIQKYKKDNIRIRINKFIIKILNLQFIKKFEFFVVRLEEHLECILYFTVDVKSIHVRFVVGKFNEYTFRLNDDSKNRREYYKYKSRNNTIHKTILDEKFNNYSQDVKNVISIFSNPTTFNKNRQLEKIYNYYIKLCDTPFLYNYEKCILILLAAKHRQFFGVPYDVAKIISYFVLN